MVAIENSTAGEFRGAGILRGTESMSSLISISIQTLASWTGLNQLIRLRLLRERFLVLCYHGVLSRPPAYRSAYTINLLAEAFDHQMKFVTEHFHTMSADELIAVLEGRKPLRPRSALITFDDGYRNNLLNAAPILSARGIPAIFHISTGLINADTLLWADEVFLQILGWKPSDLPLPDGGFARLPEPGPERELFADRVREICKVVPDAQRIAYLEKLRSNSALPDDVCLEEEHRFLNWDEVRELSRLGFEIGSHTVSHPILSRLTPRQVDDELRSSKTRIEQEIGKPCRFLAYPNGSERDSGPGVWAAAEAAGYKAAFGIHRGVAAWQLPLKLDRVNIPGNEHWSIFQGRAAGIYLSR
jgi:peptidoglycan/xylan/chitin deacetylase (PgdA/CDA1 family)